MGDTTAGDDEEDGESAGQPPPAAEPTWLLRSMKVDDDGLPVIGHEYGSTLGARENDDIAVSSHGTVLPGPEGMSVAPDDPEFLPPHRRPPEFRGTGHYPVWRIRTDALDARLRARPDPKDPTHWLVGVDAESGLSEYRQALEETRQAWQQVKPGDEDE